MSIFIRQVTIADPQSDFFGQRINVRVHQGKSFLGVESPSDNDELIDAENLLAFPGFTDVFCRIGEPGYEQKETFATAAAAAIAGGYTTLMMLPNTKPVLDTAAQISYVVEKTKSLPASILPIGAISTGCKGNDLAEMYDMRAAGAVAFSDGLHQLQNPQIMLKALQYVKTFDGVIISMPVEEQLTRGALMHEGVASTKLGMPGMPAMAEHLAIKRDLELLAYTKSKLHISGISTAGAVRLIRDAKSAGLGVTCSVSPYHLHFTDEMLSSYDTSLKVNPPLRTADDVEALKAGIVDGTIDCIASHHQPHEWDSKTCEFEYAAFGISTLEAAFGAVWAACPTLDEKRLAELFCINPRAIFGLPPVGIAEGSKANITLIQNEDLLLEKAGIKSLGKNNPFVGRKIKGRVLSVIA